MPETINFQREKANLAHGLNFQSIIHWSHYFAPVARQQIVTGSTSWTKMLISYQLGSEGEKEVTMLSQFPSRAGPNDLNLPTRPYLLKFSPPSNNAMDWGQNLIHGPLGDIPDLIYSSLHKGYTILRAHCWSWVLTQLLSSCSVAM
jgi:hypothetical protein